MRLQHPNAAGLVIARDIDHAQAITTFEKKTATALIWCTRKSGAAERLNRFQQGSAQWLVSIDMCAEGFDAQGCG